MLLGLVAYNVVLILSTKAYYMWRNATREKIWSQMSDGEKAEYLSTTQDQGNKRYVCFRNASHIAGTLRGHCLGITMALMRQMILTVS